MNRESAVTARRRPGRRRATRRGSIRQPGAAFPARGAAVSVWFLLTGAGLVALMLGWTALEVPSWVSTAGAVSVTTSYAFGLAARTGGRPLLSGALGLAVALAAVLAGQPILLAAVSVSTAVLGSVFAVMVTVPAAKFGGVVRECGVAVVVVVVAALAVAAYDAQVSPVRLGYVVLGLSLLSALGLVYRLGAGLTGLGRRGAIMVVGGLVLLILTLAYTQALARWGSPGAVDRIGGFSTDLRAAIRAVPRPLEVLLGFPALAWGVSTRARRRQGWWVCAFGAAGLAVVSVSLVTPAVSLLEAGLTLAYSAVLGLLLGYLVIRADTFLTGARGRRARRLEEATAHRPEPGRLRALL